VSRAIYPQSEIIVELRFTYRAMIIFWRIFEFSNARRASYYLSIWE